MATWRLCSRFATPGLLGRFVYVSTRSVFGGLTRRCGRDPRVEPAVADRHLRLLEDRGGVRGARLPRRLRARPRRRPRHRRVRTRGRGRSRGSARRSSGRPRRHRLPRRRRRARTATSSPTSRTPPAGSSTWRAPGGSQRPIYHVSSGEMHSLNEVAAAFRTRRSRCDRRVRRRLPARHARPPAARRERHRLPSSGSAPAGILNAAIADYLAVERSGSYGAEVFERGGGAGAFGDAGADAWRPAPPWARNAPQAAPTASHPRSEAADGRSLSWRQRLSVGNIGVVYVWLLIIVVFAMRLAQRFRSRATRCGRSSTSRRSRASPRSPC